MLEFNDVQGCMMQAVETRDGQRLFVQHGAEAYEYEFGGDWRKLDTHELMGDGCEDFAVFVAGMTV